MSKTVLIDLVEVSPNIKAAVEDAKAILRNPHEHRAKLVKAAAVLLAEIEEVRHVTVRYSAGE